MSDYGDTNAYPSNPSAIDPKDGSDTISAIKSKIMGDYAKSGDGFASTFGEERSKMGIYSEKGFCIDADLDMHKE